MNYATVIVGLLALIAYGVSAYRLTTSLRNERRSGFSQSFHLPAVAGMVLHAASIYWVVLGDTGLQIGFFSALSLTSLLLAGTLLAMTLRQSLEILGVVVFPLAGIFAAASALFATTSASINSDLQWHILTSVMAYGVLALAATQSIALAVQTHYLRTLQPRPILSTLPPIDLMEQLLFRMIGVGFILLSISLLTGFFFLEDVFAQHLVHKTSLSLVAWLTFGALLMGRGLWGWRGKTALTWTMTGFGFLIVGYFGSKLVLEFILER